MLYDVVIFDLDGTLIDSSEGIINAAKRTISELGFQEMSCDEIKACIGPPIGESIVKRNGYGEAELKRFNSVFRELYKNEHLMEAKSYPGMIELLEDMGRYAFVSIATNKRIDYTTTLLERMGISEMCDEIQALDMEGRLKKKDLVENCIKASGINDRERIVVIGDTDTDAMAAKECGVGFIGVTFGFGFKERSDVTYGHAADDARSLRDLLFG
ncbi:MAG: HAD hydrolase-like protein [Methanomassiliicoccaceae archaeon]|nr:HAD hydrolase-like protein [Methanomassiliicoccaceae archaeon]